MSIWRLGDQRPPAPRKIHRRRGDAVRSHLRGAAGPDAALPPAGRPGVGHQADCRQPLGAPGLDAQPLRRRGALGRARVRDWLRRRTRGLAPIGGTGNVRQRRGAAVQLLHAARLPAGGLDRDDQGRRRAGLLRVLLESTRPGTRTSGACSRLRPTRRGTSALAPTSLTCSCANRR